VALAALNVEVIHLCFLLFYMGNWQDVNIIPLFDNCRASIAVVVALYDGSIIRSARRVRMSRPSHPTRTEQVGSRCTVGRWIIALNNEQSDMSASDAVDGSSTGTRVP
jgi:hypothetical protein